MMDSAPAPRISVVIPTRDRAALLPPLLEALSGQTGCPPFEVVAVNDGSADDTATRLQQWAENDPAWRRVLTDTGRGPAAARNRGLHEARGAIIAFVDDDCLPEPTWLKNLCQGYEENEQLAGTGGQTLPADRGSLISRYLDQLVFRQPHRDASGVTFLLTNNASFRRDRLLELGGFDESFPYPAGEDVDLCRRLRQRGYRLDYRPEARLTHRHAATLAGFLRLSYRYGKGEALLHRSGSPVYRLLRTLWWGRRLFGWLGLPWRARRLGRERGLNRRDRWAFACLQWLQEAVGYLGVLSLWRTLGRGEKP